MIVLDQRIFGCLNHRFDLSYTDGLATISVKSAVVDKMRNTELPCGARPRPNTMFPSPERCALMGYVRKVASQWRVKIRLREVFAQKETLLHQGDVIQQQEVLSKLSTWREDAAERVASLTARQRQIMELVLAGHPSKNIAADLGISQRTVENHRASIMKKTGMKSLAALGRLAFVATWNGIDDPLVQRRSPRGDAATSPLVASQPAAMASSVDNLPRHLAQAERLLPPRDSRVGTQVIAGALQSRGLWPTSARMRAASNSAWLYDVSRRHQPPRSASCVRLVAKTEEGCRHPWRVWRSMVTSLIPRKQQNYARDQRPTPHSPILDHRRK